MQSAVTFPAPAPEVDRHLAQYARFGVELGLERIEHLLVQLGQPQRQVPIIHVAGTNGKGSVCAYLAAILQAAGYRVGRYTSPHLVSWCERITINATPIAKADLLAILNHIAPLLEPPVPTQFEVFTAAAWYYFAQQQVDVAVVEVGLGGRLDATNVKNDPLVCVLTSIGRDHWQRLGPTLTHIAQEKAGILKAQRPAVVGHLPPEAQAVVADRCAALPCPVIWPEPGLPLPDGRVRYPSTDPAPALEAALGCPGDHQRHNSALAVAAVRELQRQGWTIPPTALAQGLAQARWPGRLQWLGWQPTPDQVCPLLVDGAHNGPAAQVLRAYVDAPFPPPPVPPRGNHPVTWVMGLLSTKDPQEVCGAVLRPGDRLHLVPVPDHDCWQPAELAQVAAELCPDLGQVHTYQTLGDALKAALLKQPHPWTVLCGSLYLAGHFFETQPTVDLQAKG